MSPRHREMGSLLVATPGDLMAGLSDQQFKTRACERCSRSKAKCVWGGRERDGVGICERCFKSDYACSARMPVQRKKRTPTNRVTLIEQKIEGLVSLLEQNRGTLPVVNESPSHTETRPEAPEAPLPPPQSVPTPMMDATPPVSLSSLPSTFMPTEAIPPPHRSFEIFPGFEMPFEEVNQILNEYMTIMLPQFPFVPLPTTSAPEMSRENPLLLKVIVFVCNPPTPHVAAGFNHWFRQHIAQRVVVLNERRLELLQSILIFLAWRDFRYYLEDLHTSLMHLACGLVSNMGLDKCPNRADLSVSLLDDVAMFREDLREHINCRTVRTNVDRRTVLGLFYLSSSVSVILSTTPSLRYYDHFEQHCQHLLADREHETDALLVHIVRLQRHANTVIETFSTPSASSRDRSNHRFAMSFMRDELDQFMHQLPSEFQSNTLLNTHYKAILVRVHEPVISISPSEWTGSALTRAQALWNCFQCSKAVVEHFLAMPIDALSFFTFQYTAHFAVALVKLIKLLRKEDDPNWDRQAASEEVQIDHVIERLIDHCKSCGSAGAETARMIQGNRELVLQYSERLRMLKQWVMLNLQQPPAGSDQVMTTEQNPAPAHMMEQLGDLEFWQLLAEPTWSSYTG